MRNYLKYLSDTIYLFQRKYSLTDNQLKFLLFIGDEKGSFTKNKASWDYELLNKIAKDEMLKADIDISFMDY